MDWNRNYDFIHYWIYGPKSGQPSDTSKSASGLHSLVLIIPKKKFAHCEADFFAVTSAAMGWNSFWPFQCGSNVKEDDLKKQADLLAEKGLVKAGYSTFIVECGWESDPSDDGSPKVSVVNFRD